MWHAGNSKFAKQKGPCAEFAGQIKFNLCQKREHYAVQLDHINLVCSMDKNIWRIMICKICMPHLLDIWREVYLFVSVSHIWFGSRTEVHTEWDPELTKNCNTKCYCPQQWVSSEGLFVEFRNLLSLFIVFFGHHYNRIRSTKSFQNSRSFIQQSLSSERTFPQFKAPTFMIVIQQLVLMLKVFHDRQIKVLLSIVSSNLIRRVENGWWNGNH